MQSHKGELGYGFGGNQEVEFATMVQPGRGSVRASGATYGDSLGDRNRDADTADMDKINNANYSQGSSILGKK